MRKGPGKRFFKKEKTSAANDAANADRHGSGSLSKELYDWFGYTPSTATASAFVQQRNKIRSKAVE